MTVVYWVLVLYFFKAPLTSMPNHVSMGIKEELANKIAGPKIVLAGGSGTWFGLRARAIQEELGVPTVNLAVNAGLGIDYILHRAKKVLKKGDIIILPLEYHHFVYHGEYLLPRSLHIMTYDRDYFDSLSPLEKALNVVRTRPDYFLKGVIEQMTYRKAEFDIMRNGVLSHVNENGDSFQVLLKKNFLLTAKPFDVSKARTEGVFVETAGLKVLREFGGWCRRNNVDLYISYANTVNFEVYDSGLYREYFDFLSEYFMRNGIAKIGSPSDFFFDASQFSDTEYHLTQEAMTIRTKHFVSMLKELGIIHETLAHKIGKTSLDTP